MIELLLALLWQFSFAIIIRGWTLAKLWSWFVAAPFAVTQLGIAHAVGLSILLGLFHPAKTTDGVKIEDHPLVSVMLTSLIFNGVALLMGLLVHSFM